MARKYAESKDAEKLKLLDERMDAEKVSGWVGAEQKDRRIDDTFPTQHLTIITQHQTFDHSYSRLLALIITHLYLRPHAHVGCMVSLHVRLYHL